MKKVLLISLAFMIGLASIAQVAKVKSGFYDQKFKMEQKITKENPPPTTVSPLKPKHQILNKTSNRNIVTVLILGTSANSIGYSIGTRPMLWADDDLGAITNFHRMGPGTTPPSLSGYLGMDLGLNMGATQADWTPQIQVLAATMVASPYYYDASRYPNAGIYNPKDNLDIANAYLTYFAPNFCNTVVSGFGGYSYGTENLVNHADSVKKLKWYHPTPYTYTPEGFAISNTGFAHMVDGDRNVESGSVIYQDSVIYGRGTWNTTTHAFDYTFTTVPFNTTGSANLADVKIAADLDGLTLYMTVLGNMPGVGVTPLRDSTFYPIYRVSTDGGLNWGPAVGIQMDGPNGLAGLKNHYTQHFIDSVFTAGTTRDQIPMTTAFDHSTSVDRWGNLHIGCVAGYSPGAYSVAGGNVDSLYGVYDIYTTDKGAHWYAQCMGDLTTFRGTWTGAGGAQSCDNRTYVSKTKSGDKMFFTWNDTQVTGDVNNDQPDVFARGFDLVTNKITADGSGTNHPDDVTFLSDIFTQCYYQCASPIVFTANNMYTIPICVEWWSDPAADVTFKYVPDFSYTDANFTIDVTNPTFPTGVVEKTNNTNTVTIYPNPVKDIANVSLTLKQSGNVVVDVTNMVGQVVLSLNKGNMNAGASQFSFNVSNLTSGVYFATVTINGEKITKKLVVK